MEQKEIGIRFVESDRAMYDAIGQQFPECEMIPSQDFDGIEVLWIAIIPIACFTVQLLDFILTHVIPKESKQNSNEPVSTASNKRELLCDGKKLDVNGLIGMDREEVANTIKIKLNLELVIEQRTEQMQLPQRLCLRREQTRRQPVRILSLLHAEKQISLSDR